MKKLILSILVICLLFININVFAYNYIDDVANQMQSNVQQRIVIRN